MSLSLSLNYSGAVRFILLLWFPQAWPPPGVYPPCFSFMLLKRKPARNSFPAPDFVQAACPFNSSMSCHYCLSAVTDSARLCAGPGQDVV